MDTETEPIPSILPQRDPAVQALLGKIDKALNHFAQGPTVTICQLFDRLQVAFWKSAWAIHASKIARSLPSGEIDVRNFPAWLRGRIPNPRLQSTLHPVFSPWLDGIKGNTNHLQHFRKACSEASCSSLDLLLDFGLDIAKSMHALQAISKVTSPPSSLERESLVNALWNETLSRADLSPETLPTPTTRELTKAIKSK
ncbi:uncharacterized protein CTRU02_215282 [Colletotrichum truncatum]|uniref:Uncharacterized protein n=1 Tax=Colletotrichum truncatum TaxID=5467 RepID=A0ACC3YDF6_COLTU|nr:uncharacterized protein CTRU02_12322 [Colletotrichum truncatum]KAF6784861.1 hypothetical protein CTRU02_12322 [Colletotrichum truncatum]